MTTTTTLEQTLDLISRVGWCQGASARNVHGKAIRCNAEDAVQFSLDGAIQRVTWPDLAPDPEEPALFRAADDAFKILARCAGMNGELDAWGYIMKWNDSPGRTKEQVEHLIRCALAKEEE